MNIRPWFVETGGGVQFRLHGDDGYKRNVKMLLDGENPYLRRVYKGKYK